jgi:hypothetical protein
MLSPSQQLAAVFSGLSDDYKADAVGKYSQTEKANPDDIARLLSYLDPNVTSHTRKIILASASCSALLYFEDGQFKLLSAISMAMSPSGSTLIVGHDGNSMEHTIPVSIPGDIAVLDILALALPPPEGTAALEDLMGVHPVSDVLQNPADDNVLDQEFPFPQDEILDLAAFFTGAFVARIPLLIPLPMGHDLEPVALSDDVGIANLIKTLHSITPIFGEWAQSMTYAATFFEAKSLTAEVLQIPEVFFDGIDPTALVRGSIIIKSSRVATSSTEGKAIFRRIAECKKTNMERWFTQHPEIYEPIVRALTPSVTLQPAVIQASPEAIVKTQTRADKQDEYRVLKGKTITSLLLARESTNAEGTKILIPADIDATFDDTLLETPRNACKEYQQLIRAKVEEMKSSSTDGAMSYVIKFPWATINVPFSSALQKGSWADQPIQAEGASLGQKIGFLTFAPSRAGSVDYKRQ